MLFLPTELTPVGVAVDLVVLTIRQAQLCALAIKRTAAPFQRRWALPGGFLRAGEDLGAAASRELEEETGVPAGQLLHIEQLATFGAPKRDPRGRVVSVAYLAFVAAELLPQAGGDAAHAAWLGVDALLVAPMAFDHSAILTMAVERTRAKIEYTNLATVFCGATFTIAELRAVYEAIWGETLDPANFHRKATSMPGFVVEQVGKRQTGEGRPARVYTAGSAAQLSVPIRRGR
jgi:8-oxo-dGTP diphosphatase